jgi:dihydrofolate reductase
MFATLDGFIAGPNGEFDDYEPSTEEMKSNEFSVPMDGILFGRVTYEGFVSYWYTLDLTDESISKGDVEFANLFRKMTRIVFSRTLDQVADNTILIKDNIAVEVTKLKQQPGRDLVLICGPELLSTFVQLGLIDEYRILVKPRALGRGKSLFGEIQAKLQLKLLTTGYLSQGL